MHRLQNGTSPKLNLFAGEAMTTLPTHPTRTTWPVDEDVLDLDPAPVDFAVSRPLVKVSEFGMTDTRGDGIFTPRQGSITESQLSTNNVASAGEAGGDECTRLITLEASDSRWDEPAWQKELGHSGPRDLTESVRESWPKERKYIIRTVGSRNRFWSDISKPDLQFVAWQNNHTKLTLTASWRTTKASNFKRKEDISFLCKHVSRSTVIHEYKFSH
ncbi:unnamed protein product [Protopolystoma xenopodis]|uniref:Uncharacterized protein n=1 Tax=Protopolystoma xenopodis TaxID=117903 RepID=A0A3S5BPM7_9PLAT|nr:unnamed protein product [Protopolystoma xenopodis]